MRKQWNKVEPSIYTDGQRFRLRTYHVCHKTGQKKEKTKTLPEGTTLEQARQLRDAHPTKTPTQRKTVRDYSDTWIEQRSNRVGVNALKKEINALSYHILPHLGSIYCDVLERTDVQEWCEWAKQATKTDGELYSRDTLLTWWGVLCEMLRDMAVDMGLEDATRRVKAPLVKRAPKREKRTLGRMQLSQLVELARTSPRFAEIVTLAYTGMRAGELFGLKWSDIDFDTESININRSYSRGTWVEGGKTGVGRQSYMHPEIAQALQAHRVHLIATQNPGLADDLVFPSKAGTPRHSSSLRKTLATLSTALELDFNLTPQILRRTFNTLMVASQVDRLVLWSQMGHSSEAMTATYNHVSNERRAEAVLKVFPTDHREHA